MTETWRPIAGYEYYEVSDAGRVRSIKRTTRMGARGGSILKPLRDHYGYVTVILYQNGTRRRFKIHTLVLEAFVGPRPHRMDACHYPDPNKKNCALSNLRWDTRINNLRDKICHGTQTRGAHHPVARLNESQVRSIFLMRQDGVSARDIANRLSVSSSLIYLILNRKLWAHLSTEAA
jgi:hypothetical protein